MVSGLGLEPAPADSTTSDPLSAPSRSRAGHMPVAHSAPDSTTSMPRLWTLRELSRVTRGVGGGT